MLTITTANSLDGHEIVNYLGIASGKVALRLGTGTFLSIKRPGEERLLFRTLCSHNLGTRIEKGRVLSPPRAAFALTLGRASTSASQPARLNQRTSTSAPQSSGPQPARLQVSIKCLSPF